MKTTVEISDDLLRRTRHLAKQRGASLRTLLEDGLRLVLKQHERSPAKEFQLPVFRGEPGLTDEFRNAGWEQIRDEIYRDRS